MPEMRAVLEGVKMLGIYDKENDLAACQFCGVTALYWQLQAHTCTPSLYEQLKGKLTAGYFEQFGTLEAGNTIEATARELWRWLALNGAHRELSWIIEEMPHNTHLVLSSQVIDFVSENGWAC